MHICVFHASKQPHNISIALKHMEIMLKAGVDEPQRVCSTYSPCAPTEVVTIGRFASIKDQHNCMIISMKGYQICVLAYR